MKVALWLGSFFLVACAGPAAPPQEKAATPAAAPPMVASAPASAPAKPASPPASPPSKAAAPAKPAPPPAAAKAPSAKVETAKPLPAPALDLTALEQRLKGTDAIGLMTKLSLKNQVDDLVARFKAFHAGSRPPTLAELRPAFDLLLMKVLSLLQDKDARLASDIHNSRDALWGVLTDPDKLSRYS